jgi:hypothetical protein
MAKLQFHRNLNTGSWSYILPGEKTKSTTDFVTLFDVDFRHPSKKNKAFLKCLDGGSRKVFAWFKAAKIEFSKHPRVLKGSFRNTPEHPIYFNPTKGDQFFHAWIDGEQVKIDHAQIVIAFPCGRVLAFGVNAQ